MTQDPTDKLAAVIREVWSIRLEVKPNGFWLIDGRTAEPEVNRPGELIAEFAPGEYVEANDRCEAERNRALDSIIRAAGYVHKDDALPAPVGDVGALIKEAREKLQSYNWFVVDADGGLYSGQLEGSGWLLVSKLADALSALSHGEERRLSPSGLACCPFCGSAEAMAFESDFPGQGAVWTVFCNACEAEGPHRPHREQAIDGWNARARSATEQAIRADERAKAFEDCAKIADAEAASFLSPEYATGQPLSSVGERFACASVAAAIRASSTAAKETP